MADRSLLDNTNGGVAFQEVDTDQYVLKISPNDLDVVTSLDGIDGLIVGVSGEPKFITLIDFIASFFNSVLAGQKVYIDKTSESYLVYEDGVIKIYRDNDPKEGF